MLSLCRLFWCVIYYARKSYPGRRVLSVTIHLDDGRAIPVSFPDVIPPKPRKDRPAKTGGAELVDVEAAILRALTPDLTPTKVVARKAGYKYNPYFRAAVSSLRRKKKLRRAGNQIALPGGQ